MQAQPDDEKNSVNYYTVLGLPQPAPRSSAIISNDELKTAYHLTLLRNHPDKASKLGGITAQCSRPSQNGADYTIDEIMRAYQTLSNSSLRADYDKRLLSNRQSSHGFPSRYVEDGTHLGVETYDLDDLDFDERKIRWSRNCRCGIDEAYVVTEAELERESKGGEIYIGCRGCSLFIKVLFGLVDASIDADIGSP